MIYWWCSQEWLLLVERCHVILDFASFLLLKNLLHCFSIFNFVDSFRLIIKPLPSLNVHFISILNTLLPSSFNNYTISLFLFYYMTVENARDRRQILLLLISKFKWINWLLFPLESSENYRFLSKGNTKC